MKRTSLYLDNFCGNPTEQENRVARRLGGKRVSGSGSSKYSKGDVRDVSARQCEENVDFLVECKQTEKASISIKWEWLKKITREAHDKQQEPALGISIKGGTDDPLCDRDWIAIPARVWERIISSEK